MSDAPLPFRPRLAQHALLRCHFVDGRERIMLHDTRREEMLEIGERELEVLLAADGTRDFDGIALAAVRRGVYRRASELRAILLELAGRGLLDDGIAAEPPPIAAESVTRPLAPLPGYRFRCHRAGSCCMTYGSVPFSTEEALRSRALVPDAPGPAREERRFLPLFGSASEGGAAVALVDGRCAYLGSDARCRIEVAGGTAGKPGGCRIYPASLVDDGEAIRVSVAVECPCVLASLDAPDGGPLVAAATAAELPASTRVPRLAREVRLTAEARAPRVEVRAWSAAVAAAIDDHADPLAAAAALGRAVVAHGLAPDASLAALAEARPPAPAAFREELALVAARARDRLETAASWRSERDRSRRLCAWIDRGAATLLAPARVAKLLERGPRPRRHEALYLRAAIFGHQLAPAPLADALRERAVRLLLARALPDVVPPSCEDDASVAYPLTAVETLLRVSFGRIP